MQLGVPCWSFGIQHLQGHLPFESSAQIAKALGFKNTAIGWSHVDWPAIRQDPVKAAEPVKRVLDDLELEVDDSFIWFPNKFLQGEKVHELKCTITQPDQEARDDNFDMFKSFTRFCKEIGCPGITMSSGIKYEDEGFGFDEIYEISRTELARMVEYSGEYGIDVRPEPHNESVMGTIEHVKSMCEDVPGLKVSLDYSHFMVQGREIGEVHCLIPYAAHVHARQANRKRVQCRMEDGIIDFEAIVKELVRQKYEGNIALEYVCVNYRGCYDLDVITETAKLKKELESYLKKHDPTSKV